MVESPCKVRNVQRAHDTFINRICEMDHGCSCIVIEVDTLGYNAHHPHVIVEAHIYAARRIGRIPLK
jgi:hypothetical protein